MRKEGTEGTVGTASPAYNQIQVYRSKSSPIQFLQFVAIRAIRVKALTREPHESYSFVVSIPEYGVPEKARGHIILALRPDGRLLKMASNKSHKELS